MIAPDTTIMPYGMDGDANHDGQPRSLPFPPVTRSHILNCAYNAWWPRYRAFVPKSRIIPLTQPFIDYLQADGIFLPEDDASPTSGRQHGYDDQSSESTQDIAQEWRPLHNQIKATIKELGGKVVPKLNWSSPKDATHMLGNSMNCYSADDVYLLLKSSDFISFDLNHAFDDTSPSELHEPIPWHLVLRKSFNMNPSVEFRCFVKGRRLIGITQRDMNYYSFLHQEKDKFSRLIADFYEEQLQGSFPDENFVFDVYVPDPYNKVWLVDINPWAQRTDPLLFSWLELLTTEVPASSVPETLRIPISTSSTPHTQGSGGDPGNVDDPDDDMSSSRSDILLDPELRLLNADDPEAYSFASPQYSAHKIPKDVVEAASEGNINALRELSMEWQEALERARKDDDQRGSDDDG